MCQRNLANSGCLVNVLNLASWFPDIDAYYRKKKLSVGMSRRDVYCAVD